jgi:hypothetical protein
VAEKKQVLKPRSTRSIVIPAAKTGNAKINSILVVKILQRNKGRHPQLIILGRQTIILVIKLIELKIEEMPATCREIIKKFIPYLLHPSTPLKGG